jgi:carboxyl-terminal processing protease
MLKKTPFILLLILVMSGCSSLRLATNRHDVKMLRIAQQIRNNYVDVVDSQVLTEAAIRAMMNELDPYSQYRNAVETRALRDRMRADFFGTGAQPVMIADTLHVGRILDDSPAQEAGLMWGDKIIYINNTLVAGVEKDEQELMELLQGARGATVNLRILRRNTPDLIDFQVAFDRVSINTIDAVYMVTDDIGYIRLNRFSESSWFAFREALNTLQAQGMEHLILDLIANGGGRMNEAIAIVGEFLEHNKLITYMEGRSRRRRTFNSARGGEMLTGRVVVLVDERSASASELVAGALQDWDRGVIVGRRTWGKSSAQWTYLRRSDNTSFSLTEAHYYIPTGRNIQRPFESGDWEVYRENVRNRIYHAENFDVDSIQLYNVPRFNTLVNNRTVFGGGGILPDYFVVMDRLGAHLARSLVEEGIIHSVAMYEVGNRRDELLYQYPDVAAFQNNFQLSENVMNRVKKLAKDREVEWCDERFERISSSVGNRVKAFMAFGLYDLEAFHKVQNDDCVIFQEGLRIISDPERYENLLRGIGSNVGVRN